jgi:hypothetical protein
MQDTYFSKNSKKPLSLESPEHDHQPSMALSHREACLQPFYTTLLRFGEYFLIAMGSV